MAPIKTITVAGASGNLGPAIVNALLKTGNYQVTVFTRSPTSLFSDAVKVVVVNYNSIPDLTTALQGQNAVVSTLASGSHNAEKSLIQASVAAGVTRYFPSEFGCDIANEKTIKLPIFQAKSGLEALLKDVSSKNPSFTYTLIRNTAFLDWGLAKNFLLDFQSPTPSFYDGGDRVISASNIDTIGEAVVGVLEHLDETTNRPVYIQDAAITQRKLLTIAQKLAPERKWEPVTVLTADLEAKANEQLAKGNVGRETVTLYIIRAMFGEGFGGKLENLDNELLGLRGKTDADLEDMIRPLVTTKSTV